MRQQMADKKKPRPLFIDAMSFQEGEIEVKSQSKDEDDEESNGGTKHSTGLVSGKSKD
jgi:hypothetical protein